MYSFILALPFDRHAPKRAGFAFRPPCTQTRVARRHLSTSAARRAAAPQATQERRKSLYSRNSTPIRAPRGAHVFLVYLPWHGRSTPAPCVGPHYKTTPGPRCTALAPRSVGRFSMRHVRGACATGLERADQGLSNPLPQTYPRRNIPSIGRNPTDMSLVYEGGGVKDGVEPNAFCRRRSPSTCLRVRAARELSGPYTNHTTGVPHSAVQQRAALLVCVIDNDPDLFDTTIPPFSRLPVRGTIARLGAAPCPCQIAIPTPLRLLHYPRKLTVHNRMRNRRHYMTQRHSEPDSLVKPRTYNTPRAPCSNRARPS